MRKVFISVLIFGSGMQLCGQTWDWAATYHSTDQDLLHSFCGCDRKGNAYFVGRLITYTGHGGASSSTWQLNKHSGIFGELVGTTEGGGQCQTDSFGNTLLAGGHYVEKIDSVQKTVLTVEDFDHSFYMPAYMPDGGFVVNGWFPQSFIRRYTKEGKLIWTITAEKQKYMGPIATDRRGNTYLYTTGNANPINSGLLCKFDSSGNKIFEKTIPHHVGLITVVDDDHIYVSGWQHKYPVQMPDRIISEPGSFIMKFNTEGTILWYRYFPHRGKGFPMAITESGEVFFCESGGDIKITRLNADGISVDSIVTNAVGPLDYADRVSLKVHNNSLILVGSFAGKHEFGSKTIISSGDIADIFVAKYTPGSLSADLPNNSLPFGSLQIFPNPSGDIFSVETDEELNKVSCTVRDATGRCIMTLNRGNSSQQLEINLGDQPPGVYLLEITAGDKRHTRKLVRQ